jgi:hypothetical protein
VSRVWFLLAVLVVAAGCSSAPDERMVQADVQRRLDDKFRRGLLQVVGIGIPLHLGAERYFATPDAGSRGQAVPPAAKPRAPAAPGGERQR